MSKQGSYKLPSSSQPIEIDPQNNGEYVRKAFLIEGILNLGTIPLITHPRLILPFILNHPHQVNESTVIFARMFGLVIVAALSPLLFAGARNTQSAIESRSIAYIALGGAEVFLVPLLINEALKSGGHDAVIGFKTAFMGALAIATPLLWRAYVLLVNPAMLGKYREARENTTERTSLVQ